MFEPFFLEKRNPQGKEKHITNKARCHSRTSASHKNNKFLFALSVFLSERKKLRGQSILLTHAILVGFTIFLVYAITTTFVGIKSDYQSLIGGNEIKEICFIVKGAVDKVYINTDYNFTTTTQVGYVDINMPDKISGASYRAKFFNRSVSIESFDRSFNDTCRIGLDVGYNGTTNGGLTRISYVINANGTKTIEMTKL